MKRSALLLPITLLLGVATAPAQMIEPEIWELPRIWQVEMEAPLADAEFFGVFGLRLFAVLNSEEGVGIWQFNLREGSVGETVLPFHKQGLPEGLTVTAFESHYAARKLLLAGTLDGQVVVYQAALSPRAEPTSEWTQLPPFPEQHDETIVEIRSYDEYAVFFADRMENGRAALAGYAARFDVEPELFRWIEMPSPVRARENYAPLLVRDQIILAGGKIDEPGAEDHGRTASYLEFLTLRGGTFGMWEKKPPAVPARFGDPVGTAYGAALFLTPGTADAETSRTIHISADLGGGAYSGWTETVLAEPATPVRALIVDPGNSHLIVVSEPREDDDILLMTAYGIPKQFMTRRPSSEEARREHLRRHAARPQEIAVGELLQQARDNNMAALAIVVGDDEDEDIGVRTNMNSTRYRYSTINAVSGYFRGNAGSELLQEHGITQTPAYILLDAEGRLLRQHAGSIPTPEELFTLTSPTRSPQMME